MASTAVTLPNIFVNCTSSNAAVAVIRIPSALSYRGSSTEGRLPRFGAALALQQALWGKDKCNAYATDALTRYGRATSCRDIRANRLSGQPGCEDHSNSPVQSAPSRPMAADGPINSYSQYQGNRGPIKITSIRPSIALSLSNRLNNEAYY